MRNWSGIPMPPRVRQLVGKISNNVILFSGAKVIYGVSIGDNCVIGVGVVVTKDVPDRYVVVRVPAMIVPQKGLKLQNGI